MSSKNNLFTISDVAKHVGVSIVTTILLNGKTPVQTEKAERVKGVIVELNFAARALSSSKTYTIVS